MKLRPCRVSAKPRGGPWSVRAALTALVALYAGQAAAQTLPPISTNEFYSEFNFGPVLNLKVTAIKASAAGLTSINIASKVSTPVVVTVLKVTYDSPQCKGNQTPNKSIVVEVPGNGSAVTTFPTPVPLFGDVFGYVCLVTRVDPLSQGTLYIQLAGYSQ